MNGDYEQDSGNGRETLPGPNDIAIEGLTFNELNGFMERMTNNVLLARADLLKQLLDPRRDIDKECGYPDTQSGFVDANQYQMLWEREAIAARVVELHPRESWQVSPEVYEDEDPSTVTEFEEAWGELGQQLRGESSYFKEEEGSPIWDYLRRIDEISGIGQYGIIYIAVNDGLDPINPVNGQDTGDSAPTGGMDQYNQPVVSNPDKPIVKGKSGGAGVVGAGSGQGKGTGVTNDPPDPLNNPNGVSPSATEGKSNKQPLKILFLRVFPENLVNITRYETNINNPRFGQPVEYLITVSDPRGPTGGMGLPINQHRVHWTRVLHIADIWHTSSASEVFAVPRMRPVLNRLLDLRKLYAGSAEMYWRGAFPGLAYETHPNLGTNAKVDITKVKDTMEQYMNSMQRYLLGIGGAWKMLAPTVVDPTPQIKVQIEAICIKMETPERIFTGSERGKLASDQDDKKFTKRMRARQIYYITPRIIIAFIDRLIYMGVLPAPQKQKGKQNGETKAVKGSGESDSGVRGVTRTKYQTKQVFNAETQEYEDRVTSKKIKGTEIKTTGGYCIFWPDMQAVNATDKATVSMKKAQTVSSWINGNCPSMMDDMDFWTLIMDFTEEEAKMVIENHKRSLEDQLDRMEQVQGSNNPGGFGEGEGDEFTDDKTDDGQDRYPNYKGGKEGDEDDSDPFSLNQDANWLDPWCVVVDGFCLNCGGEGGKPGPCPGDRTGSAYDAAKDRLMAELQRRTTKPTRENNQQRDRRLATEAIHAEIVEYGKIDMKPCDVNSGECGTLAREAIKRIREKGGKAFYGVPKVGPAHVWVVAGGLHYDVQHPEGVSKPSDLTFFKDWPDLLDEGWEAKQELHPTRNMSCVVVNGYCINCGGEGGKPGPCPTGRKQRDKKGNKTSSKTVSGTSEKVSGSQGLSAKSQRAKDNHKIVDEEVQRYAEEYNEPRLAKVLGGKSWPDAEPVDVETDKDGVELKTMVLERNKEEKITMDKYAQVRKVEWEREEGKTFHTVISDDRKVYNGKGEGEHDESKRVYYYRRGIAGSARIAAMFKVEGGEDEIKRLMAMSEDQLPKQARRTDAHMRVGKWEYIHDDDGKRYVNSVTGVVARPKK